MSDIVKGNELVRGREHRAMLAASAKLKIGGRYWLDRHIRGWGEVEVLRLDHGKPVLVYVRDCTDGDTYPVDPRDLCLSRPKSK